MVYLFVGEDCPSKTEHLKAIRKELLNKGTEQFNLDILYAKGLSLKDLQEKLMYLALNCQRRIVVIKEAQNLKEDLKEFILEYAKKPQETLLVLDITLSPPAKFGSSQQAKINDFIKRIQRYVKLYRFRETEQANAFSLSRQISSGKADSALRVLSQLLNEGQRPERILGGLRYAWEKDTMHQVVLKRRLRLLLDCDIDIKTGRLKAPFALEKLIISLCGFTKLLH